MMANIPPPIKKPRISRTAWNEAKKLIWAGRKRIAIGMSMVAVNRASSMVLPAMTKVLIDEVIGKQRADLLIWVVAATAASTTIQGITSFGLTQVLGIAAQRAINDLRKEAHQHVARLPVRFFEKHKSGEMISRIMSDADGIRNIVGTGLVQMVGGVLTAGLAVTLLLLINWRLTLVLLIALAAFVGIMFKGYKYVRPIFRERRAQSATLTGRLNEFLNGMQVVKAYAAEKREEQIFARQAHSLFRLVAKSMTGLSALSAGSTVLMGLVGVGMMYYGGREAIAGRMTEGDLFMFAAYTMLVIGPMIQISAIGSQITEAFAGLDRIHDLLNEPTELEEERDKEALDDLRGDIEFQNVVFEYDPGVPVLKGLSFSAPAGTTTALVGSSGSGKSTLIGLVMAFNYPKEGRVLVDGRDLSRIRLKDYRAYLGVVLQDNFLFDGSIAENIAYARPGASREEVAAAAKIAHVNEFTDRLEKGYDTIVGERGIKVSGGQRQRIAIARAILADPRILILDEATSSLDSESEAAIQDGFKALRKGRTTFVIAHRLSTIRNANQILVLESGRIVERGSHAELIAKDGRYKQLYDKQYKLEMDRYINPGEEIVDPSHADATANVSGVGNSEGDAPGGFPLTGGLGGQI